MDKTFVRDLMTVGVPTCKLSTPIKDVANFLITNNVEEMVVLGEEGEGVGVCGYEELVQAYTQEDAWELTAEQVMTEGIPELPTDITLALAAQLMKDKGIRLVTAIGAGDSFNAGFIHKFLQGAAFAECQEFANLTGAVSTTAAGGTSAFLPYENFRKTAKDVFGYHL